MSDYFSRGELWRVERGATRGPVSAVQPVSPSATLRDHGRAATAARNSAPDDDAALDREIASGAEYAKVHARIADILAALRSPGGTATVDGAASEIQSMIPEPTIMVPLPPASKEAVESSVRLARRIADQARYAHAAQANLSRGVVDQIVSPAL